MLFRTRAAQVGNHAAHDRAASWICFSRMESPVSAERCVARGYQPHFLRAPCWTGRGGFAKFKFGWELRELEGVPLRCVTIVSTMLNPGRPTSVRS